MIDVKRLVIIFLIFAASVSSLTVGVSYFSSLNPATTEQQIATVNDTAPSVSIPANAFLPATDASANLPGEVSNENTDGNSGNLTDGLANYITQALVSDNPDGPISTNDGQISLASPDPTGVMSQFAQDPAVKSFQAPDWNAQVAAMHINVSGDTSDAAKVEYGKEFSALENKYFIQTDLSGLFNNAAGSSGGSDGNAKFAKQQIDAALQAAANLSVPQSLLAFHKSFLKLLSYESNALGTLSLAATDPFQAELIIKSKEQDYNNAEADFAKQLPQAEAFLQTSAPGENKNQVALLFNKVLGINEAHAQFVGGVVFDPSVFGRLVMDFINSVLLQILKNQIVTLLQNKVLKLIQNSGSPKFVQNWSGFLTNAFNSAAGSALGEIIPGLCPGYSAPLSAWLKNEYQTAQITPNGVALNGSVGTTCTLQGIVGNPTVYYGSFSQGGGWGGFGAMLKPNNNIFGSMLQAHDSIITVANAQQQAAQNKAIAGAGAIGAEVCSDGSKPSTTGKLCPAGTNPIVTAPGKNFSDVLSRNMASDIDLITNANDITGLLATVAGGLMQQIIQSGANGILGSAPAGTGVVPTPPPAPLPVACSPKTQTASAGQPLTFAVTGGNPADTFTWSAPNGFTTTGTGLTFNTAFVFPGTYGVSVSGASGSDFCSVTVN